MFCPLTEAIYLTSAEDKGRANVEFQWEDDKYKTASRQRLLNVPFGTLSWNLIALRDLEPGDEVGRLNWKRLHAETPT